MSKHDFWHLTLNFDHDLLTYNPSLAKFKVDPIPKIKVKGQAFSHESADKQASFAVAVKLRCTLALANFRFSQSSGPMV